LQSGKQIGQERRIRLAVTLPPILPRTHDDRAGSSLMVKGGSHTCRPPIKLSITNKENICCWRKVS